MACPALVYCGSRRWQRGREETNQTDDRPLLIWRPKGSNRAFRDWPHRKQRTPPLRARPMCCGTTSGLPKGKRPGGNAPANGFRHRTTLHLEFSTPAAGFGEIRTALRNLQPWPYIHPVAPLFHRRSTRPQEYSVPSYPVCNTTSSPLPIDTRNENHSHEPKDRQRRMTNLV